MVDEKRVGKCNIFQELDENDRTFWFDCKQKKFLHNVDTFYFSVKLAEDFTTRSQDENVLAFRAAIDKLRLQYTEKAYTGEEVQFFVPAMGDYLNVSKLRFVFYDFCLELPDMFDVFICCKVPGNQNEISVTPEILVQIRSEMLWMYGAIESFERCMSWVRGICDLFHLTIFEVKENRTDFCWHSNYLKDPNTFFTKENLDAMRHTYLGKRNNIIYYDKGSSDSDFSYYARGKRGDKTFLRIYNKSMEVIQEGYKAYFLKTWLFHGMINRYDFYVYERAYLHKSWEYVTIARLRFYYEHGTNEEYREQCRHFIEQNYMHGKYSDAMIELAEKLTPPVNVIINVEFQLMRKASKSYDLVQIKDNSAAGPEQRVYDFFDNHRLIVDYLTNNIFRLVEKTGDSNKSRRPNCAFWTALRKAKLDYVPAVPDEAKMKRIYKRQLNYEKLKKSVVHQAVTMGIYQKGVNQDDPMQDVLNALCMMNDNDMKDAKRYKEKKIKQLNKELLADVMPERNYDHEYLLLDRMTGEYIDPDVWLKGGKYSAAEVPENENE